VSVVSDGYRIRKARNKPIYVDGRPAGALKSRIVRDGGMVQIGQTLLILDCSPDGLARRTHGIATDSDIVWALSEGATQVLSFVRRATSLVFRIVRRIVTSWTAMLAIAFLLYVFWRPFHLWTNYWFWWIVYKFKNAVF
jgi:hypothetical protein